MLRLRQAPQFLPLEGRLPLQRRLEKFAGRMRKDGKPGKSVIVAADREMQQLNALCRRAAFALRFTRPGRIPFRSASKEVAPSLQPSALNLCSMPPRSIRFVPHDAEAR